MESCTFTVHTSKWVNSLECGLFLQKAKKPLLSFIDLETVTVSRFDVTALACVTAQKYNYVLKGFSSCQSLNTIISSLSNRRTPARCLADLLSSCRDNNNVQLLIQRCMLFISSNQTTKKLHQLVNVKWWEDTHMHQIQQHDIQTSTIRKQINNSYLSTKTVWASWYKNK